MSKKKFHLGKNGPTKCTATKRACPYEHFSTEADAKEAWEEQLKDSYNEHHTQSKKQSNDAIMETYENASTDLNTLVYKIKELEGKQKALIEKIKNAHPETIPDSAYEKLESYENKLKRAHNQERRLHQAYKLAELEAFENGLIKQVEEENVFKARGTKWSDSLGIGYHSDNNITFELNKLTQRRKESLITEYAAWSGKDLYEARDRLNEIAKESRKSNYTFDSLLTKEFQDTAYNDKKKNKVFVDLETSSLDPYRGEIIEIGIIVVGPDGKIKQSVNERYDMENPEARDKLGTGAVHVHKINPEDIAGKPRFSDPEVQKELGAILNDPNSIIIPHNAGFEHGQLSTHLDGYYSKHVKDSAESLKRREQTKDMGKAAVLTQDTRAISAYFLKSKNNTLKEFATSNGVSEEEYDTTAHGAYADADMTSRAYKNFKENLTNMPIGEKYISPNLEI